MANKSKLSAFPAEVVVGEIDIKIPLPGFGGARGSKYEDQISGMLDEDNLTFRSFVIREIPGLSEEGTERDGYAIASDVVCSMPDVDELNFGMQKAMLSFSLPKGSYATVLIQALSIYIAMKHD